MPGHFSDFIRKQRCPGMILVPKKMRIGPAIEDLLLVWQVSEAEEWINQMRRGRLPL